MDQVLQWFNMGLHVVLAGFFALLPGILFWLGAIGVSLLVQRLRRHSPSRSSQLGSESALVCRLTRIG